MTPRVIYDCMVYLQAAWSPGGPGADCVAAAEDGRGELFVTDVILAEVRDVLTRPRARKKYPSLASGVADASLARVARFVKVMPASPAVVTLARDPKDAKYLDLAVAAGAKLVVSRDNDLLDLMTGEDPDAVAFRAAYPDIAILRPEAFLTQLRAADPGRSTP